MSPSTARQRPDTAWMDRENERDRERLARWNPDAIELRPARPGLWLQRLRTEFNATITNTLPQGSRPRLVVAYALVDTLSGGVDADLDEVCAFIQREGHVVAHKLYDVAVPERPRDRPGWNAALELVFSGRAEGIAAVTRRAVSVDDDEYVHEVRELGEHGLLFLLARSEAAT